MIQAPDTPLSPTPTALAKVRAPGSWEFALARPGGYAWWYFDALNADGDGFVCIFFFGSVFSPVYALRLKRGDAAMPLEHAAVNLCLYRGGKRVAWVMSEFADSSAATDGRIVIGNNVLERRGGRIRIALDDYTMPFRRRVQGEIEVEPLCAPWPEHVLSPPGDDAIHAWRAVAPLARVSARFHRPGFQVDTVGYHDMNCGDGRLERAFKRWGWARFHGENHTTVVYNLRDRSGARRSHYIRGEHAASEVFHVEEPAPPEGPRRGIAWGMSIPSELSGGADATPRWRSEPVRLLEQAPFYARYTARLTEPPGGRKLDGVGEFIDFDRFDSRPRLFLLRWLTRPSLREPFLF